MRNNLFRPQHLQDAWRDDFVIALRLRNVSGRQIGDALALVDAHCTDSGEPPEEAFGDPVDYATHVAAQVRPVDLASSLPPLRAGLLGLAILLAVAALLAGVTGLTKGVPAEVRLGSLVAAVTGAVAIALLSRFASVLDPRRGARPFLAILILLGAMMWPSLLWTSTAVTLNAWLSVGLAAMLLAAAAVSLRTTGPDLVVEPLTGRNAIPSPRWLTPGVHWLLPVTLAAVIVLILVLAGR